MNAKEIRSVSVDEPGDIGGTGAEEAFRNLMLREIAAQLAELNAAIGELKAEQERER